MIEALSAVSASSFPLLSHAKPSAPALPAAQGAPSFADTMRAAAGGTVQTVAASEKLAGMAMAGQANLQDVVQATISAELAVETAISIRNKVVESTQEILRMPI